jgi:hypothetical protein
MPEGVGYGSNIVVGTGLELNYIGKHCYAYSGKFATNTTAFQVLSFTSGKGYIVGHMQLNGGVDDDNPADSTINTADIQFNGNTVALIRAGTATSDDSPMTVSQRLIIPPFTQVVVIVDSNVTQADRYFSVVFTGRIHF